MLFCPLGDVASQEVCRPQKVPTTHSSSIQDFHQDLTSNWSKVTGVSIEVDLFIFIDVWRVNMFEFLGTGPSKFLVSFDTLLEEPRLVPLDGLDMFWGRTNLVGVDEFEFLFDLVLVECWGRSLDGSKVPLAAIIRFRLLWNRLFDLNQEVAVFG